MTAAVLAQQADPAACTLEVGGLATPASKLRVQIFRVNHLTNTLRLDEEDRVIQETLRPLAFQEEGQQVTIESVGAVSFSAIRQHMDSFKPHCVHFMGHGTEERLLLADDNGRGNQHGASAIAKLFQGQPQCMLAVFNCCLSAPIAEAVCKQDGVFLAIGTSDKVDDAHALAFAKALWGSVLLQPAGTAFEQACMEGPRCYHLFQGTPLPMMSVSTSSPVEPLRSALEVKYTSSQFTAVRILDFEENTAIQLEEVYTKVAIVDAQAQQVRERADASGPATEADLVVGFDTLYNPKQPSHIDHLFGKPGEPTSKRVLVVGRAGIGKTTLGRKLAHLWATGHPPLTSRFDLVFRIALRGEVEDVGSIEELLHVECLGSSKAATLEQLTTSLAQAGARVLLLLDGYDEFQAERCPLLAKLIGGKLDPGFSILITSRPAAAQQLMRSSAHNDYFAFDDVFELLGFSTAAITEYVGKYFAAKPATAAGMVAYLEAHPTVRGAARVPIVAALLCILYESHEERGAEAGELPSTLTGIFQEMVEYLLERARLRLKLKGDGDDEARVQAGLEFLEALAWQGMQQGRILFSQEQFEAFSKPPHSIERATLELALQLGFLTTAESRRANEKVARVEYHFLHLTLQEFLAARNANRTGELRLPWWKKRLPFATVKVFEDRASLRMVWQFGCGLLGADAGDLLHTIVSTARGDKRQALLALQCQAESGCPELVGLLEGVFKDGKIDLSNTQLSAVELAAVVDIVNRFEIRALDLSGNSGLGVGDADVLGPALSGERAPGEVRVGGCGLDFIARLVHGSSDGLLTADAEMRIARAWGPRPASLDLSKQGIGPEAGAALAKVLRARTTLTSLTLSGNELGAEGGAALAEALKDHTTLTSLDLNYNSLGAGGGAALAEALKGNTTLTSLDLSHNNLGAEGGAALAEALKGNTTLTSLNLAGNELGPEAGAALAEALKDHTTLTSLTLSGNELGAEAGAALAEALPDDTLLNVQSQEKELDLQCCAHCGAHGARAQCGRCRAVVYCGKSCQWAHWHQHRGLCKAKEEEAAPVPSSSSAEAAVAMAVAEMRRLHTRGRELERRAEYLPALAEFQRVLEIAERAEHLKGAGSAHAAIANIHERLGQYECALEHYEKSKVIAEGKNDRARLAAILGNMANVHQRLGQHQRALVLYQECKNTQEQIGDGAGLSKTLGNMGGVYQQLGQHLCALELYQESKAIKERSGDVAGLGKTLGNMGIVYERLGQHLRALEHYKEGKAIQEALGDVAGRANALNNMGNVYKGLGQHVRALEHYKEGKEIQEQIGDLPGLGRTSSNMASVYQELGDPERALELYKESRAVQEKIGDSAGLGNTLNNMGIMHRRLGQHKRALELYKESKQIRERIGDAHGLGATLGNMGGVYQQLGQPQRALELYQQDKAICERLGDFAGVATCLYNIGLCLYDSDKSPAGLEAATKSFTQAFQLTSRQRRQLAKMGRSAVISIMQDHFDTAIFLQAVLVEAARHSEALAVAEASRAQTLDLHSTTTGSAPLEERDGLGISWQAELAPVLNTVFVVYSLVPNYKQLKQHSNHLFCWAIGAGLDLAFTSTEASELTALVNLCRHSDLAMRNRASPNVDPIDAAPPPPTDLGGLERGGGVEVKEGESPMDAIRRTQYRPVLTVLRELLIPPALEELLAGRGFDDNDELNVVFVPTDCLALVPFAALRTPDGTPLIEQCSVATCPSLSHFKKAMAKVDAAATPANAGPALLVGNPSPMPKMGGGAGFLELAPLPDSQEEVEQLQTDLATPTALIGPDATKANLLKLVNGKSSSPCILHLATHGHHTDPSPKSDAEHNWDVQGCLAFADAKTTAASFILAREIAEWRLPTTQLAVLSACSSHVGTFKEAEGGTPHDSAAGLSLAFLMAGVPRSLVSLWPVYDFATKELMLHFYRHLQLLNGGGSGKDGVLSVAPFTTARALRRATRDLWRDHPDYKRCHVMWAAFVVSGVP